MVLAKPSVIFWTRKNSIINLPHVRIANGEDNLIGRELCVVCKRQTVRIDRGYLHPLLDLDNSVDDQL